MLYTLFVVLHILSAGVVIGLITVAVIGTAMRRKVQGTPGEIASIRSAAMMAPIMGNIGSIGLLVSGVALTLLQYSFFPFTSLPWLALMQTDFVIIMAIVGAIIAPRGKKILTMANAELSSSGAAQGASVELRALANKQYATIILIAVLVVIAVALGESKSLMWVGAN